MERPDFFELKNGSKVKLPFSQDEYQNRLDKLRTTISKNNLDMIILTSMHNIAYYTGFIYCSFGRPYGCVISEKKIVTISANIDASQPWRRSFCDNVIYTDWKKDNFLKAIVSIIGKDQAPKNIGIENDHVTIEIKEKLNSLFSFSKFKDVSKDLMKLRIIKSKEEIEIIRNGAKIADIGAGEIVKHIKVGASELEIAMTGRNKMELEIAKTYPEAEYMDTWVWFQSGINTDGAHNPKTSRKLVSGDILSLNTFPMISGYYMVVEKAHELLGDIGVDRAGYVGITELPLQRMHHTGEDGMGSHIRKWTTMSLLAFGPRSTIMAMEELLIQELRACYRGDLQLMNAAKGGGRATLTPKHGGLFLYICHDHKFMNSGNSNIARWPCDALPCACKDCARHAVSFAV